MTAVLFSLAAAGHTLTQLPQLAKALGYALAPVWAFSAMGAGLFWAFATALFEDRPRLDPRRFIPALALLAVGIGVAWTTGDAQKGLRLAHNFMSAVLIAHVLFVIWKGWQADLVESRRRLRGPILGVAALYAISVISVQTAEVIWGPASFLSPFAALVLLLLGFAAASAFLQGDPELFAATAPAQQLPRAAIAIAQSGDDGRVTVRLDQLMRRERVYRDEQLSIGALAQKVGVPEYRLRRLINQQLGYRNFNAYLNSWRLADAKNALADPTQVGVPISTIALDAGFQSLGPFNRAFKAETGLTPSEFRAQPSLRTSPVTD